jgi:cell division septum initiation protein DivIVA
MARLADGLKLELLRNPELDTIASTVEIRNGRLHVQPFQLELGDIRMNVSGSNGVDQSLQYALAVDVPRALLGSDANRVVASLIARTGRAGIDLQPSDVIQLGVQLTGTVKDPTVTTDFSGVVTSAEHALGRAVASELERRAEATTQRADSAKEAARRQAQAEAERIVREAEERAALVREEAAKLAETVKREGYQRADDLLARATNPVARAAARPAADRLRKEADDKAAQIVREADERANGIVAEARKQANALTGG